MSQLDRVEQLLSQLVSEVSSVKQEITQLQHQVSHIEQNMVQKEEFTQALEILHNIHQITSALTHNQIETQENVFKLRRKGSSL